MEGPRPLETVIVTVDGVTFLRLSGDAVWAYSLWDTVRRLILDEGRDLVIDLRGLDSLDENGLDDMLQAVRWGRQAGIEVRFIQGNPEVQRAFTPTDASLFRWMDPD